MIYLISDLHFFHQNIMNYENRPFKDLKDMETQLITNWNSVVKPEDTVWFLGDFSFGKHSIYRESSLVRQLNGIKNMIMGNHDRSITIWETEDGVVQDSTPHHRAKVAEIKSFWKACGFNEVYENPVILDSYFILSHEPIIGLNKTQIFANIHGHLHGDTLTEKNYYNVSVERINYKPVSFEEIKNYFSD